MIALIAGTGDLPGVIAARLVAAGDPPLICAMRGVTPDIPDHLPRLSFRLETLMTTLTLLRQMGVTRVCMLGAMQRPPIDPAAIDAATAPVIPRLAAALARGDDGTLREIVALFTEQGLTVIGAHQIAPELLPPAGVLTRIGPSEVDHLAAALGQATIALMGQADSGQACVIRDDKVVAREGPEGTDAMLARLTSPTAAQDSDDIWPISFAADLIGQAADWLSNTPTPVGGILFKAPKPGQERRVDLPVIGPGTAQAVVAAGLQGIIIEAEGVMVLDLAGVIRTLDAAGRFFWVRAP
jgi:UDP-2,3-diacylglucosamine hydrolase